MSGLYKSHDLPIVDFYYRAWLLYLNAKQIRNLIIGGFNIDLRKISHEHLNKLLCHCFIPGFETITRP